MYSNNFTKKNTKFCLDLHYNGVDSYFFVNGTEIIKIKAKVSEFVPTTLCPGNITEAFSEDITKKKGLNGYIYDFSVDYDYISTSNILGIHKYLMKKKYHSTCLKDNSCFVTYKKMFKVIKQILVSLMFFGSLSNVDPLECVPMNNEESKVRPKIIINNNKEPLFYPFNIKTSKCSGSCNNISDPYAKLCVPDVVKNLNIKVLNLMSRTNETRHIK